MGVYPDYILTIQYQEHKQPNRKMGRVLNPIVQQDMYAYSIAHEEILSRKMHNKATLTK